MPLFVDPIVVLDTETSGFTRDAEILAIEALCIDEWGSISSSFSSLVRPKKMNEKIERSILVNKMDKEDLLSAPSLSMVTLAFAKWLSRIPTKRDKVRCTAFNSAFDQRMLRKIGFRVEWSTCLRTMINAVMISHGLQPLNINGRRRAPSLKEACDFFGIYYPEQDTSMLANVELYAKLAILVTPEYEALVAKI